MRILLFSSEFPPGPGGIGANAHNLTNYFVDHGHDVVVYTASRTDYPSESFDLAERAKVIRYPINSSRLLRGRHLISHVWRYRRRCDWIILSGLINLALYNLIVSIVKARVLCIVHGHEITMASRIVGRFVRQALLRADHVVTVSDFAKRILRDKGIMRPVITIPNGVNLPQRLSSREPNAEKLVLITVGSVTKRKGQQNVITALPYLLERFQKVEYHMVGLPKEKEMIESLAFRLGVSEHVVLHGAVSNEQRDALLLRSDVFMMLSENLPDGDVEGFGIAVLEANSLGLPAIGSRNTGVEQAVNPGISGCLVDSKNSEEICNAISLLLSSYNKFSKGACAWASEHDWKRIGGKYLNILENHPRG